MVLGFLLKAFQQVTKFFQKLIMGWLFARSAHYLLGKPSKRHAH